MLIRKKGLIRMADGFLIFDTKIDEQGFNAGIKKLSSLGKSGITAAGKAVAGITAAAGAGAAALVKSSLDVVASMEQNLGGVETLFEESADTVIANAKKAYESAGMSANTYMETVTSFSASLLQSLGNDTKKAAESADRAITDMSDNANKMGTSMELIQNAYQGFAKQNYTMLDNLKLGYGGTKTEMERLLSDAEKLKAKNGEVVDYSIDSFDDIIQAIHVIQEEMGITGTTASEAATTIEGSVNSAKAAWENFEAGVISANELVDTFWTATSNILNNLGEIIPRLGKTGMDVVSALSSKVGEAVPQLKGITDLIGNLADKLKGMSSDELMSLGKAALVIAGAVPSLSLFGEGIETASTAVKGFSGITSGITASIGSLPKVFQTVKGSASSWAKIFGNLGSAIALPFQDLGGVIKKAVWDDAMIGMFKESYFATIANKFSAFGSGIKNKFSTMFSGISGAFSKVGIIFGKVGSQISAYTGIIGDAFKPVLQKAASFVPAMTRCMNIATVVAVVVAGLGLLYNQFGGEIDNILLMVQTKGPEVVTNFCNGITEALPNLIAQGSLLLNNLMLAITANLPAVMSGGISIVSGLISGIASQLPMLIPTALQMLLTLVSSLLSNIGQLVDAGINLLNGLADGILNAIPVVIDTAPEIIADLASAIITNLPEILQAGVQIITKLAAGLVQAVPELLGEVPGIISDIKEEFTSINWGEVGSDIISGIANGLSDAAKSLAEAAANAAEDALNWVKEKLGIHSPSRVFRDQVGKMMALGIGVGFEKNIPIKSMNKGISNAVNSLKRDVAIATSAQQIPVDGVVKKVTNNYTGAQFDYKKFKKVQKEALNEANEKPVVLNRRQIDRATKGWKGGPVLA